MADTIEEYASKLKIKPKLLIEQLKRAGIPCDKGLELTEEHKQRLLEQLKQDHGAQNEASAVTHFTVVREEVTQLTVRKQGTTTQKKVNVVTKKKRKFIKRKPIVEEEKPPVPAEEVAVKPDVDVPASEVEVPQEDNTREEVQETAPVIEAKEGDPLTALAAVPSASEDSNAPLIEETPSTGEVSLTPEKDSQASQAKQEAEVVHAVETSAPEVKPSSGFSKESPKEAQTKERSTKGRDKGEKSPKEAQKKKGQKGAGKFSQKGKYFSGQDSKEPRGKSKKKKDRHKRYEDKTASSQMPTRHGFEKPTEPVVKEVGLSEGEDILVSELAQRMSLKGSEVIKALMKHGQMLTINQAVDPVTAMLVVEELGHKPVLRQKQTVEDTIKIQYKGEPESRAPVITIMGHVDHGKTSLLDFIRRTRVASGEAGGITQHIGAYHVKTPRGGITFIDTPGHSAFSNMRARGAKCTDLVVLVVAADDGVKPQTVEAIQHARAGEVPIVVAVNKIDKENMDVDRIKTELSNHDVIPEDWGGDTMFMPVSAKTGQGIDELLESILLQAEILELSAYKEGFAKGIVIESRLDKGRGPVATVLIQNGALKKGDILVSGTEFGRVRAMLNDSGRSLDKAGPSIPVEVLGLSGAPVAGDEVVVVADERKAREIASYRQSQSRESRMARQQASKLEGFMDRMQEGELRHLNIILKADVQGSVEALNDVLEKLSNDEVRVNIVGKGVGGLNESDVNLAMASKGILVGFNVRADASARRLAEQEGIQLHYFGIIYDVIDAVQSAITGLIGPKFKEEIVGLAEVRDVFRSSKFGAIAGCKVIEGKVKRNLPIRVLRNNVVIYEGSLESLKRFKEDVTEVRSGMECGIGVKNYNDVKVGDQIEVFDNVEVDPKQS